MKRFLPGRNEQTIGFGENIAVSGQQIRFRSKFGESKRIDSTHKLVDAEGKSEDGSDAVAAVNAFGASAAALVAATQGTHYRGG